MMSTSVTFHILELLKISLLVHSIFTWTYNYIIDIYIRHSSHQRWKFAGLAQRCVNLWNNLGFSLCAALSDCYMVTTSDEEKKSEMEISANGCVAVDAGNQVQ